MRLRVLIKPIVTATLVLRNGTTVDMRAAVGGGIEYIVFAPAVMARWTQRGVQIVTVDVGDARLTVRAPNVDDLEDALPDIRHAVTRLREQLYNKLNTEVVYGMAYWYELSVEGERVELCAVGEGAEGAPLTLTCVSTQA